MEAVLMVLGIIALVCFIVTSILTMVAMGWYYVTFKPVFDTMSGTDEGETVFEWTGEPVTVLSGTFDEDVLFN